MNDIVDLKLPRSGQSEADSQSEFRVVLLHHRPDLHGESLGRMPARKRALLEKLGQERVNLMNEILPHRIVTRLRQAPGRTLFDRSQNVKGQSSPIQALPEFGDRARPRETDTSPKFNCPMPGTHEGVDTVTLQHLDLSRGDAVSERQPCLELHIAFFQCSPHAGLIVLTEQAGNYAGSRNAILNSAAALAEPYPRIVG